MSFDAEGRLETGLKFLSIFGLSECFVVVVGFRKGFYDGWFQRLIYNGSEQRNNLVRAFKQ